jgi:predicted hotdog family 3-hydroxylacyl-ACP dehydratase
VPLGKNDIAKLIPHAGAMCLLDEILNWDESGIRAATRTHLDERNPLRHNGHLPAVCAVEYAAQTMAVHGSLASLDAKRPRAGYLVSARDVVLHEQTLDTLDDTLVIEAERIAGDVRGVLYRFDIRHRERAVANGILMVILDAGDTAR